MNDEALVEETEEEVDVIALLADQVKETDDIEDDDIDSDEIPETIEELKEALRREREIKAKRNKSLKKSKQATHRIQEENEALLRRLDELDRRIGDIKQPAEADDLKEEIEKWQNRVEDDPSQALAYTDWKQSMFEEKVANYLGTKFAELQDMIGGLQSATNPEVMQYRTQMDMLRNREEFADLDDGVLLTLAKGLAATKIKKPRGSIGGKKPGKAAEPKKFVLSDEERQRMGF